MSRSRVAIAAVVVLGILALAACAPGPNPGAQVSIGSPAGFWLGLWQGAISPITFIVSLFNDKVNIYEVHNTGNWYNFGFMLGVAAAFSGAAGSGARAGARGPSRAGRRAAKERPSDPQ